MKYKIGVDGGGTKTQCILVDHSGRIVGNYTTTGCNPNVVGPGTAAATLSAALKTLCGQVTTQPAGQPDRFAKKSPDITDTLLCMAGSRGFWEEFAASLNEFGQIVATDDSLPILELATQGRAGLVLHSGTGSFVAARGPDNSVHYAGGRGWRFGDSGSGYDIGSRAIGRALLELQGWAPGSGVAVAVCSHAALPTTADASAVTRYFYSHADATRRIAALAPAVLRLAGERDAVARQIVLGSTGALFDLALTVATKLFPATALNTIPAGLSGPILTHPLVLQELAARSPMPLTPITGSPIEGVRQLLMKD